MDTPSVGGTLVAYHSMCHRKVWFLGRKIEPDQRDDNLEYGRFIHQSAYARERKDAVWQGARFDWIKARDGEFVVAEVKKSSKQMESARKQLLFYLYMLEEAGVRAKGEIRIPEERKAEQVVLDDEGRKEIKRTIADVLRIIYLDRPPEFKKIPLCRNCAYRELCWS